MSHLQFSGKRKWGLKEKNIDRFVVQLLKNVFTPLLATSLLMSCASYKVPTRCIVPKPKYRDRPNPVRQTALNHPLYKIIPRHRCQIRWYDLPHWLTWSLFGNDDDGIFGEEVTAKYKPEMQICTSKAFRWFCRNPFHNFTFYVIGSANRKNGELDLLRICGSRVSAGRYRCPGKTNYPSKKRSCFYIALHGGKPFVSLRMIHSRTRKTDMYLGWRSRGNFGIKCVLFGKRKSQTSSSKSDPPEFCNSLFIKN